DPRARRTGEGPRSSAAQRTARGVRPTDADLRRSGGRARCPSAVETALLPAVSGRGHALRRGAFGVAMGLLQIHDPKAAPTPIGIDLGTTNSLVAHVTSTGAPTTILDCDNQALVPSVVHYASDGRVLAGKDALALAEEHPRDTIISVKRFMG